MSPLPKQTPIGAVILAAGYSSRIGRPKALLPLPSGETVLGRMIRVFGEASIARTIVVVGHCGSEIAGEAARSGAMPVWNGRYPEGQTTSLQAGLRAVAPETAGIVLSPVDYALTSTNVLRSLIAAFRAGSERLLFFPSHNRRRGHPFLIDASLRNEYLALPPGKPGREIARKHPDRVAHVAVDDDAVRFDIDTPQDYAAVCRKIRAATTA